NGMPFEYHNDPEKTASTKNKYGWTTIGDIGWVDEDGWLYLTDRKSFMIISGGVNIYPQEIENLLTQHPKIADVAVFGAPDEEMGERVVAVVQP
ncbi:acyl-CoA synthetase, partial [Acinetobacter baumannii]